MIENADWHAVYRELIAEGRRTLGELPTTDELLAYSRGELSGDEAAWVRESLVYYPDLLRALAEPFPDPEETRPGDLAPLTPEEQAQDWARLQAQLAASEEPLPVAAALKAPLEGRAAARPIRNQNRRRYLRQLPLAAAILLATVLAGLYLQASLEVRRLTRALESPRVPEHLLLLPDGTRGTSQPAILLPSEPESFLLAPALIRQPTYDDYRLDLFAGTGDGKRKIWSASGIERGSDDTFEIWVPRSSLEGGPYQLELYGLGPHHQDLLATYTIQLAD